ncbi:B-box zinc finger protein 21-like [Vigna angularis]|uniref:B-box zinc finger protein 21-like n=1 Tax=Phaseolus angularis TaxID=3914 RepID=UPI0022B2BEE6|nr:B-box zinc finger protein 21-like [Vigna angularis]
MKRCIHHANKLASKHQRFSLLRPRQHPICNVCQVRNCFFRCLKFIHVLCRECDVSIQSANEHTLKHDRFLLAGVKLSASSSSQETPSPSNSAPDSLFDVGVEAAASTDASSISEYLIETLPGWQVEDFLDSYSVPFRSGAREIFSN